MLDSTKIKIPRDAFSKEWIERFGSSTVTIEMENLSSDRFDPAFNDEDSVDFWNFHMSINGSQVSTIAIYGDGGGSATILDAVVKILSEEHIPSHAVLNSHGDLSY